MTEEKNVPLYEPSDAERPEEIEWYFEVCSRCYGTGYIFLDELCPQCLGEGFVIDEDEDNYAS